MHFDHDILEIYPNNILFNKCFGKVISPQNGSFILQSLFIDLRSQSQEVFHSGSTHLKEAPFTRKHLRSRYLQLYSKRKSVNFTKLSEQLFNRTHVICSHSYRSSAESCAHFYSNNYP